MKRRKFLTTLTKGAAVLPVIAPLTSSSAARNRQGSAAALVSVQPDERRDFFFRPANAWAADFIPLYSRGEFQLFYLHDFRDTKAHGEGTPWYRISTKNLVDFTEHGEAIPRGSAGEQDLFIFTGSVLEANGQYHAFYTGHNPHVMDQGKPLECIMHAVSDDLQNWKKFPEQKFFAPAQYEPNDWRDSFVFRNEETQEFNMLVAARYRQGVSRRRGFTANCVSKDLINWKVQGSFYSPGLYYTHECPDLFKMGDWWYLIFSEFTDTVRTRYRMSRSLNGPWITPLRDTFDGHAFYAAKTASDGLKRFLFGWNPTRDDRSDSGGWNWGGNLVVHEVYPEKSGELAVRLPEMIAAAFGKRLPHTFEQSDQVQVREQEVIISAKDSFAASPAGVMPDRCKIDLKLVFGKNTRGLGLMLRASDDYEKVYYIRLEPLGQRLVFDMWPRKNSEVPFMAELEREIKLEAGSPVHLQVLVDGTVGVAYVNDQVAMNFRLYDIPSGKWGVFVQEGEGRFYDVTLAGT